jgi:hypothetical protein
MIQGDWKTADEIRNDIASGTSVTQTELITDLWQRVDELRARIFELERRLTERGSN